MQKAKRVVVWPSYSTTRTMLQVLAVYLLLTQTGRAEDSRNPHPNHRHSLMSMKDLTDHWIGMPKSPYVHYTASVTSSPTFTPSATSAPVRPKKTSSPRPKKKPKTSAHPKRRLDDDDRPPDFRDRYKDQDYPDFDYDYAGYDSSYPRPTSMSPYVIDSASSPKTIYVNPSGSSSSMIFAGVPKVATYVVPSSKRYVVQRVKSQAMYVPPASLSSSGTYAAAASDSGVRRIDPMDYDDSGNGGFLGPQDSFPPRAVMNKISQSGQQQPCHGPECHQHHKGLVRFYWRRVVYPTDSRGRRRRPGQFRRPPRQRNRRRFRDGSRSPSDQTETFASGNDDDEEEEDDDDTSNRYRDEDDDEEEENNDSSRRRQTWRPGKGYGHDLHEGSNYNNNDRMVYRDKRYAYRRRMRNNFYNSEK